MTYEPDEQREIYERIRDQIAENSDITNFAPNSPERAITEDGFAQEIRERQHELLSVQLACLIDYSGKEITEDDLENLGLDSELIDIELLNEYQADQDLDELVKRNGIERDPGAYATGTVTFEVTNDEVDIPTETEVATEPDSEGSYLIFETDQEVSPAEGENSVEAPVTAAERGSEYNVGSGSIEFLPSPPSGVEGVENIEGTTGGEDEESNEGLRERSKDFLINSSGGGTSDGLIGALVDDYAGLTNSDIIVDERYSDDIVDVIVDGGPSDSILEDAIDVYRPLGMQHQLVRPNQISIDIVSTVTASGVDSNEFIETVNDYLAGLGIGQDVIRDQIIAEIMNVDDAVEKIDSLDALIVNETHVYDSGTDIYTLSKAPIAPDSVENVNDGNGNTYEKDVDFEIIDDDGDGDNDSLDWSFGGSSPDDSIEFQVDYGVPDDIIVDDREKADPSTIDFTVN